MQYWHRRLHLSVTDSLRFRRGLPNVSDIATPGFYRALPPLPPGEGRGEGETGATETRRDRATTSSRPAGPDPIEACGLLAEIPRRPPVPGESPPEDHGPGPPRSAAWRTRSAGSRSRRTGPRSSPFATGAARPARKGTRGRRIRSRRGPAP